MMEKRGIVEEQETKPGEKVAENKCSHPTEWVKTDKVDGKEIRFCTKCDKYIKG